VIARAVVIATYVACSLCACAPIPPSAVNGRGTISIRAISLDTYVIDGHRYPIEAATWALRRLQASRAASGVEFLIDAPLLAHPVLRSDPMYESFKSCSEIEKRAWFLEHDAFFTFPVMYEYDPASGKKGPETKCSQRGLTVEM